MRKLIAFFVDNYVLTFSIFGALVLFGVVSSLRLGVDLLPEFEIPIVAVTTFYDGAGPEEVARGVAEPIEGQIATLPGIASVSSISNEGFSIVIAQFDSERRYRRGCHRRRQAGSTRSPHFCPKGPKPRPCRSSTPPTNRS